MLALNTSLPGFESLAARPRRPVKNWIAVASAEHVRRGRAEGFMQVCHGKAAPLKRLRPGDRVVYYSPSAEFGGKDRLQAFTALGEVAGGSPYAFDMGAGFVPFRREVVWRPSRDLPIQPLLERLEFARGQKNWGYRLRFGLLEVAAHDMDLIAAEMLL
nr:EVE domain-containing protein [Roseateles albus]